MREACADSGAELRDFNGEAGHVHLLVHYPYQEYIEQQKRATWTWTSVIHPGLEGQCSSHHMLKLTCEEE
jgi:REP element-mobilizing transposase RayT